MEVELLFPRDRPDVRLKLPNPPLNGSWNEVVLVELCSLFVTPPPQGFPRFYRIDSYLCLSLFHTMKFCHNYCTLGRLDIDFYRNLLVLLLIVPLLFVGCKKL